MKDVRKPKFGKKLGFIYPAVWRGLTLNRLFSPSMWVHKDSALAIDLYIVFWWLLEVTLLVVLWRFSLWSRWPAWLLTGLLLFRIVDMLFVHVSFLIKGFYRRQGDWFSASRIVLLLLCNTLELIAIYGALSWVLPQLLPTAASYAPALKGLFDGLYFSAITATTVGYGVPSPVGWISKLMATTESAHVLLLLVSLIAHVRSYAKRPVILEDLHASSDEDLENSVESRDIHM